MTLKEDMRAYSERWAEVNEVVAQERRTAPMELRWKQLNSLYAFGRDLGLHKTIRSETAVYEAWAKIKEETEKLPPKA